MADKTIAALTDGATAHLTDKIYASRDPFDASGDVWICPQYIRDMLRGSEHTWTKTQTIALGTITDPANILALTATWNDAADTFTGIDLNVTDTASGVSSLLMSLRVGGVPRLQIRKDGMLAVTNDLRTGTSIWGTSNSSRLLLGASADVILLRESANILAQNNGVNAQVLRIYNTYTDASNYERGVFDWTTAANVLTIGTQAAGTGSTRNVQFVRGGLLYAQLSSAGVTLSQALVWATDSALDIGASGANRPRNGYFGGTVIAQGQVSGAYLRIADGTTPPAAVGGLAQIYVDTADGDLKVIFGDGTVKTIMTDT